MNAVVAHDVTSSQVIRGTQLSLRWDPRSSPPGVGIRSRLSMCRFKLENFQLLVGVKGSKGLKKVYPAK